MPKTTFSARKLVPAVGYIRMSSKKQDKSPQQQRDEIVKHARNRGYRIIRWYQDDGKSGGKEIAKRIDFLQMIKDAERLGDFEVIVSWNRLRFDRYDTLEGAEFKLRLRDAGVILDTVADGVFDWSTEEGQLLDSFHSMKGKKDLLQISRECIRGKVDAFTERGRPLGGQPPYGMARLVTDDKARQQVVPRGERMRTLADWDVIYVEGDAEEMQIVRWLFETFARKDVTPYWLSRQLNLRGVPSPHGKHWRDTTVRRILRDRAYVGDLVAGAKHVKESFHRLTRDGAKRNIGPRGRLAKSQSGLEHEMLIRPGRWKPVIDIEVFNSVQAKLNSLRDTNRKARVTDAGYPLSGILHCGHCGSRLVASPKKMKDGVVTRYNCGRFMNTGKCGGWKVDQGEVITEALKAIRDSLTPEKIAELAVRIDDTPQNDPIAKLRTRIEQIDKAIQQGNRRVCETTNDRVASGIMAELERLHEERSEVDAELRALHEPPDVPALVHGWTLKNAGVLKLHLVATGEMQRLMCSDGVERDVPVCEAIEPLELRRAFHEIGLRMDVFWTEREKRTRAGKYRLDRADISINLGRLVTQPTSDRSRSILR